MKRQEARERLRKAFRPAPFEGGGRLLLIGDVQADEILSALGVEVEPEESELPEKLTRCIVTYSEQDRASRVSFAGPPFSPAVIVEYVDNAGARLADALFAAYNDRPRWRMVDPPALPGTYLTLQADGRVYLDRWVGDAFVGVGGVAWMPIPKP